MKFKPATIFVLSVIFSIFNVQAFAANPDLTGTWKLDAAKSEGLPPGMNQEMNVALTGDKLSIETKLVSDQGEQTVSDFYMLDGKEADFAPKAPGGVTGKGKRTAKWTTDGIEVSEVATFDAPDGTVTVKMTRKWTLSADGKTLQIDITAENPQGTQHVKRVFTKN